MKLREKRRIKKVREKKKFIFLRSITFREDFHVERHVLRKRVLDWPTTGGICIPRCPPVIRRRPRKLNRQTSSLRRRTRAEDTRMSSERVRPFLTDAPGLYSSWHTCMRLVTWSGVPRRCAHKRTQSGHDHLLSVIVGPHLLSPVWVSVLRIHPSQHFVIL